MEERKIHTLTRLYYANPLIQKAIFDFCQNRETVPRYTEGFGKRPDTLQYPSDIMASVNKGATSFHTSEELWRDPLQIDSNASQQETASLRTSWDLLIDVDSPYLDFSKIATKLLIQKLEQYGIKHYGLKFSGSKGFHIIVPSPSFPQEFQGLKTKDMFPEWPRAICEFLMHEIKPQYNQLITKEKINFEALEQRTKLTKEDVTEIICPNCGSSAKKSMTATLVCDRCSNTVIRPNFKVSNRKLKCTEPACPGLYEMKKSEEVFFCENCKSSSFNKSALIESSSTGRAVISQSLKKEESHSSDFKEEISGSKLGSLDLVLVAPRHLFRTPYSLHEKTALASVVLSKEEIDSFVPPDANPLKVKIQNYYVSPKEPEAQFLLAEAINWKKGQQTKEEAEFKKKYSSSDFTPTDFSGVTEEMFPQPIKKLLKGLQEGRKRGLFILLTFLRALNFQPDYIAKTVLDWNKHNDPPLKEGYIKSQIDWHMKQKKKILPPNYANESFYKDLNLLSSPPKAKNPISEVARLLKKQT